MRRAVATSAPIGSEAALARPGGVAEDVPRSNDRRPVDEAPLRVAYDATLVELDRTGGGRVTRELGAALGTVAGIDLVALRQPPSRHGLLARRVPRGLGRELAWLPRGLARQARRAGADLIHLPAPLSPPMTRLPLVMTVHDTFPWEHPEWCSHALSLQHRLRVAPALERVACIIVPSAFTAGRVIERLGVDPRAVRVVPHGVSTAFRPRSSTDGRFLRRAAPYVLGQWSTVPRKNLAGLLACFERLCRDGAPHDLLLFGDDGPRDRQMVARLERSSWRHRIHRLGWVRDQDLVELYRGAEAFVFPTLGEGFGFPPLEAMACGTAVVSTTAGSVPEVTGGACVLVEPGCEESLARATREVLESRSARAELSRRGRERARAFTWSQSAALTRAAYRVALERAA